MKGDRSPEPFRLLRGVMGGVVVYLILTRVTRRLTLCSVALLRPLGGARPAKAQQQIVAVSSEPPDKVCPP